MFSVSQSNAACVYIVLNTCKLLKNCSFTWETRNGQFERQETCLPTALIYSYLVAAVIQNATHTNNFMFGDHARLSTVMFNNDFAKNRHFVYRVEAT